MLFHNLLHDCESQSSATLLCREKWFEDAVACRLIHTLSHICDGDSRVSPRRLRIAIRTAIEPDCFSCEANRRTILACIDRIRNYINEHLAQLIRVPLANWAFCRKMFFNNRILFPDSLTDKIKTLFERVVEIYRRAIQ